MGGGSGFAIEGSQETVFLPSVFRGFCVRAICRQGHSDFVDQARKQFARQGLLPKGVLGVLRGNEWTQSGEQKILRASLCALYPRLGRAIGLREALQEILAQELSLWLQWAGRSRLAPFRKLSKTIKKQLVGVLAFLGSRVTNGLIEEKRGLIQLAKRMARGFRSFRYLKDRRFPQSRKADVGSSYRNLITHEQQRRGTIFFFF